MTRSKPEAELTMGERVIDVGNVLMLDPLFAFYVRPGRNRASIRGYVSILWPTRLPLASANLRPPGLGRPTAGLTPRLRRPPFRTTLRKVLRASLITLRAMLLSPFRFTALCIQTITYVTEQAHR